MSTHISIHQRVDRQNRDLVLFGRLFANWSAGREQVNADAEQRLDAIEQMLARLERTVRMTSRTACRRHRALVRSDTRRAATPLAANRI